jgi:hypothetical protein
MTTNPHSRHKILKDLTVSALACYRINKRERTSLSYEIEAVIEDL